MISRRPELPRASRSGQQDYKDKIAPAERHGGSIEFRLKKLRAAGCLRAPCSIPRISLVWAPEKPARCPLKMSMLKKGAAGWLKSARNPRRRLFASARNGFPHACSRDLGQGRKVRPCIEIPAGSRATIQALGRRSGGRYLPLQDDISSVAFWYQAEPHGSFPALPGSDTLEII